MEIKLIKTEQDYQNTLNRIDQMSHAVHTKNFKFSLC